MNRCLFKHFSEVPSDWFKPKDYDFEHDRMHSRDDGSFYYDELALRMLDDIVNQVDGVPYLNSMYRSPLLNARVGGAPASSHKKGIAFDLSINAVDPLMLVVAGLNAGCVSMGLYKTFVHFDTRSDRKRFWWGKGAQPIWAKQHAIRSRYDLGL